MTTATEEPACSGAGNHSWSCNRTVVGGDEGEDPGVTRTGDFVVAREHCEYCGAFRVTQTSSADPLYDRSLDIVKAWAANLDGGHARTRSVIYEPANAASLEYAREREAYNQALAEADV